MKCIHACATASCVSTLIDLFLLKCKSVCIRQYIVVIECKLIIDTVSVDAYSKLSVRYLYRRPADLSGIIACYRSYFAIFYDCSISSRYSPSSWVSARFAVYTDQLHLKPGHAGLFLKFGGKEYHETIVKR